MAKNCPCTARRISCPSLSACACQRDLPRTRIERIAAETTKRAFGTSAQLWMNLQNRYDVEIAKREIGKKLDKIEPLLDHAVPEPRSNRTSRWAQSLI